MKVIYNERIYIDRYTCMDRKRTRNFDTKWVMGGLTYFRRGQFEVFTVETDFIIDIIE